MNATVEIRDGRADFDFLRGGWSVRHRRLKRRGVGARDWEEFDGTCLSRGLLGGLCNVDENEMPGLGVQGLAFRTFDIQRRTWAIYWVSSASGLLQEPVFGHFEDGIGRFYGVDLDDGRPVRVAFVWKDIAANSAHWSQAFSYDHGKTWEMNWEMQFRRSGPSDA